MIVVKEPELRLVAAKVYNISRSELSLDEILLSIELKFKVSSHVRALARQHGCVAFEGVVMVKGEFKVENGGLWMPDGSVNRKRIVEVVDYYAAEIDVCALLHVQDIM